MDCLSFFLSLHYCHGQNKRVFWSIHDFIRWFLPDIDLNNFTKFETKCKMVVNKSKVLVIRNEKTKKHNFHKSKHWWYASNGILWEMHNLWLIFVAFYSTQPITSFLHSHRYRGNSNQISFISISSLLVFKHFTNDLNLFNTYIISSVK